MRAGLAFAFLSGLLLVFSFPAFGSPLVAWFALAPLLIALDRQSTLRGLLFAWVAAVCYFTGTLYWVTGVMQNYGDIPRPGAIAINGLLVLYQATYVALFGAAVARLTRLRGSRLLLASPLVWVTAEFLRAHFLSGFPWVLLGYSQAAMLPVAQGASLVGVFGLSGLVASISAALAFAVVEHVAHRPRAFRPLAAVLAVVVLLSLWGSARMRSGRLTTEGTPVRVAAVQGNVSLDEKFNRQTAAESFRGYLQTSREAAARGARLILWPESSIPFYFADDRQAAEEVRRLARDTGAAVLLGGDEIQRGTPVRYFNSAYFVKANGDDGPVYQKMHLVPFGEYVPAKSLFFFMSRLVEAVSDFSAGTTPTLFPFGSHRLNTSICYEVVYPDLVRQFVRDGSELLTTITNDAWFGRTSAPYQHFAQASMRAIENGRYLVRAANTGISGLVDPYGRVLAATSLFEPALVVGDVRFLQGTTVYTRVGDVVAYAAILATLWLLLSVRRRVQ